MNRTKKPSAELVPEQTINLGIVGGGKRCKDFLELVQENRFPYCSVNVVGVCDINPEGVGMLAAGECGIYTTADYRELLRLENLDGILELTGDPELLIALLRYRPPGVWVLEHASERMLRRFLISHIRFESEPASLEPAISDILLHHSNDRIALLDQNFSILDANDEFLKVVERTREAVIGGRCHRVLYGFEVPCPELQPGMKCPMMETLKTGRSAQVIQELVDERGHPSYCQVETYPVKDRSGAVVRVVEIRRDITEELPSRWEMRLRKLKMDMRRVVQEDRMFSLGRLSASCAHEINNPIQGLLTFCHLMQSILAEGEPNKEDLAQFREYLALMSSELERCGNIVTGLLSFARERPMEPREVDLNEALRAVTVLTRHHMELQDIRLTLNLHPELLPVKGDINHLQQCFLNLIFNAIEAMPDGGDLLISSSADAEGKYARVVVQDTGCGIAPKSMDKIFDPFYTTKPPGEGTGLGLSIVYGIIKRHNGEIEVKSEPGEGSTFTTTFPLA